MAEEISPISHLEKTIAGETTPISHLEHVIALYGGSGGSGTNNYNALLNKPSINGVELTGNKTLNQLGIDLSKYTTTDKAISKIELVDAIPTGSTGTTTEKCLRLTFADGTTVVDVSVNDLVGSDEKQKAIVCIVDDDGTNRTSDAYTGMTTWLKDKGIPMNFAICHDTIGTSGKYTVTELQELQANGNDILIHGNPKLVNLTSENDVINEIEAALQFHTSNGLKPTNIYVYPQGLNSDGNLTATQVKEIVGRYFDYGLNVNIASMSGEDTKGLWNKAPLVDKLNIARMEVTSTKGFDANKSKIDACIENKGLLILFTHSFQSQFTSGGYDEFKKIINYLSTQDVEFLTVSKALDKVESIVKNYDDTQVKADIAKNKSDIADLDTNKQDKTDNALDTTDKTVVGAINEINGNSLDNITFSADYKNIIINRKSGLNPYTIPISAIIHNAKLIELNDVDSTNIGDGKTLVYDGATKKHKYVSSTGTDELVKMDSTTDAKHLSDLIDKSTIVNDNGVLKVKKLDGQEVTIAEINHLKGLTMNVMNLVNSFANGGVKVYEHTIPTYADLSALDRSGFVDGIKYFVYVQSDETHGGAKTTYICDKSSTSYFCVSGDHRDFTTSPIDLANEVTGKLGTANIDVNALWKLLTINDTYKTLTTKDEVFGTHGAKALYDELVADIGKKANATDLTTHTSDTDIHITSAERDKWNKTADKVGGIDVTELWSGSVGNLTGVVDKTKITLNDDLTNYKFLVFDLYCGTNRGETKRYYSRIISVQQFTNLFNKDSSSRISFTYGYGNFTDCFDIYYDSTTKVLNTVSNSTQCLRIVGIN